MNLLCKKTAVLNSATGSGNKLFLVKIINNSIRPGGDDFAGVRSRREHDGELPVGISPDSNTTCKESVRSTFALTNCYSLESELVGKEAVLKTSSDVASLFTEIQFLKKALDDKKNAFIVKILGDLFDSSEIFRRENGYCMERAMFSLDSFLFESNYRVKQSFISNGNQDEYRNFLKRCERFFTNCLDYLKQKRIVYCDWKFENILCFATPTTTTLGLASTSSSQTPKQILNNLHLKLADFGSIQSFNTPIKNPQNINIVFTSPNLSPVLNEICPIYKDDCKSVCYMFFILNNEKLPWLHDNISVEFNKFYTKHVLCSKINIDKLNFRKNINLLNADYNYWPPITNEYFQYLETNV